MTKSDQVQNRLFAEDLREEASAFASAGDVVRAKDLQDQADHVDPLAVQPCGCHPTCVHGLFDCSSCEYAGGHAVNCSEHSYAPRKEKNDK